MAYHYDLPYGPLTRYQYWQAGPTSSVAMAILDGGGYDQNADLNGDGRVDVTDLVKAARGASQTDTVTAMNTLGYLSWVQDQSGEEHNSYDERGRVKWTLKRIIDVEATNDVASAGNIRSADIPVRPHSKQLQKSESATAASGAVDSASPTSRAVWGARALDTLDRPVRNFFTAMTYDSQDRITRLVYPDGTYVFYHYNSRGLLESVPNVIERYDYNPAGQNKLLQLACGVTTSYDYDHRLRLTSIHSVRQRDGIVLQDLNYAFDGVSNISGIQDGRSNNDFDTIGVELGITPTETRKFNATQSFLHDSLYRLTQASNPTVWGTIDHRYDRLGNMVLQNVSLLDPDPMLDLGVMTCGGTAGTSRRVGRHPGDQPGPHAVTETPKGFSGPTAIRCDANGNIVRYDAMRFLWGHKDRLAGLSTSTNGAEYTFDYRDGRKSKFVTNGTSANTFAVYYLDRLSEVRDDRLIKYVYAGENRIADSMGSPNGADSSFRPSRYSLHDNIGSAQFAISSNAAILEHLIVYPFGKVRMQRRSQVPFAAIKYAFSGKETDDESQIQYFEARFYLAEIGAFISMDRVLGAAETIAALDLTIAKNPQSLNLYSYARRCPLTRVDRTGKNDQTVWDSPELAEVAKPEMGAKQVGVKTRFDQHGITVKLNFPLTQVGDLSPKAVQNIINLVEETRRAVLMDLRRAIETGNSEKIQQLLSDVESLREAVVTGGSEPLLHGNNSPHYSGRGVDFAKGRAAELLTRQAASDPDRYNITQVFYRSQGGKDYQRDVYRERKYGGTLTGVATIDQAILGHTSGFMEQHESHMHATFSK